MADIMKQLGGKELPMLRSAIQRCTLPIACVDLGASQIHGVCIEWNCNFTGL